MNISPIALMEVMGWSQGKSMKEHQDLSLYMNNEQERERLVIIDREVAKRYIGEFETERAEEGDRDWEASHPLGREWERSR